MDDNFLYQNRPTVRSSFREILYTRLTNNLPQRKGPVIRVKFVFRICLACLLLLAVLFSIPETARASVLDWIKDVAGFLVHESETIPGVEDTVIIPADARGSLADVQKHLPFKIVIPTYLPNGFYFVDHVDVYSDAVFLQWSNGEGDEILMQVATEHGQQYLTGPDSAQEIQINGQPAMLIQGGYDDNHNWDSDRKMIHIVQRDDDVIYWLVFIKTSDGELDYERVTEELIRMMSSIE